jgi:hypothetical protein
MKKNSEVANGMLEVSVSELRDIRQRYSSLCALSVETAIREEYWLMVYCNSLKAVLEPQTLGPMRRYCICAGVRDRFYSIYETNRRSLCIISAMDSFDRCQMLSF